LFTGNYLAPLWKSVHPIKILKIIKIEKVASGCCHNQIYRCLRWQCACHFLLVINSNFDPIFLTVSEIRP